MNSNTFFTRVEILFLNTAISFMSGLNRIRIYSQMMPSVSIQASPTIKAQARHKKRVSNNKSLSKRWEEIYQALIPLFIWALLGLAAGFLIGLIKPL